jgi:Rubisco Assembly chaperone C-terminal domain/Rubisco accumulation factor 1 alpha helical domain/Rubisco accumulation factor 1 helix turn helix domain
MSQDSQVKMSEAEAQELMRSLLHKEGSWVEWGQRCQQLQKAGYSTQRIFEDTGFQNSQQNLVIVASQVFDNLVKAEVAPEVLDYFRGPRSDVLYEFRVLNQEQRVNASLLAYDKRIDIDGAILISKAIKDVSRMSQLPEAFTNHPGDWVAYLAWKRAKSQKDLQQRSRLIAQGLKFAYSSTAREAIEKLLSDFTVINSVSEPLLPLYRLELEEELPRIVPLAGSYPLGSQAISTVEQVEIQKSFSQIKAKSGAYVPIPGWQVVLKAEDPVGYLCPSNLLPKYLGGNVEEVLVILDRANRAWDVNSYFVVEIEDKLELRWFETAPEEPIIGQLVLILRPKKILDESNITQPWQMDD